MAPLCSRLSCLSLEINLNFPKFLHSVPVRAVPVRFRQTRHNDVDHKLGEASLLQIYSSYPIENLDLLVNSTNKAEVGGVTVCQS